MTEWMRRHAAALLLPCVMALLPFGSAAELPIVIGAIAGIVAAMRGALRLDEPATQVAIVLFLGYWLPELVSAFDSFDARKSWTEVAADLRFLPFLLFATIALREARAVRMATLGIAFVLAFWCVDALLQAATGWSLGGGAQADRLSGIFGDENLKLGGVIAVLSPFGLLAAWRAAGARAALAAFVPILIVVLLAGARASWIALAVVCVLLLWRQLGRRRGGLAIAALAVVALFAGVVTAQLSPRFAERVDRTAAALRGDTAQIDYALAGRLPIWRTALAMAEAHPLNGVGARAFRVAYPDYAASDDPFVDSTRARGALHAHQLLLEIASETGVIGVLAWLGALFVAWRVWWRADVESRARTAPATYALVALLFPINTHYAVYSSFWSVLLMVMVAIWVGAIHSRGARD